MDPLGDVLAEAGDGPTVLRARLDQEALVSARATNPSLADPPSVTSSAVSGPADQQPRRSPVATLFCALTLLGLAALVAAMVPVGPDWLDGVGAVTIAVTFTATLAARTGGRPVIFGALALAVGVVTPGRPTRATCAPARR